MIAAGRALFAAYEGLGWAVAPLAGPHLARRARRGKEDPARMAEKRGKPSEPAPAERPVWIHAVSLGESVAAMTLASAMAGPVLLTTSTPASAARVAADAPQNVTHQYAPLDSGAFLRPFLAHWRPRAALFVEGEIWPGMVFALRRNAIPLALANARLSARTFRRWDRARPLIRPLFAAIPRVLAATDEAGERFRRLGAADVRVTGQLKFDAPPPVADPAATATLAQAIASRPVWLAASTHEGEDAAIVAAHRALAGERPNLLTIIAPRHPERGADVAKLADHAPRRAAGALPSADHGFYIADTLGEMGTLLATVPIVFLGGSLVPLGGHNPAEPAAFARALLTGPDHGPMFEPFLAGNGATCVTRDTLIPRLAALLDDPQASASAGATAAAILSRETGATRRTLAAIADWLERA